MNKRNFILCGLAVTLGLGAAGIGAGQVLWAPKGKAANYVPPHKPHTKLSELLAKNKGKNMWREVIVDDDQLKSEYLFLPPGTKTPQALHPDTRSWWVVMDGEVRFDIETQDSLIAKKGSMVQVPMQTLFSYEVVGTKPALIFETNIAGARTLYADKKDIPKGSKEEWLPVDLRGRKVADFGGDNKPHVTFDEVAGRIERGEAKGTQNIVWDDRGNANFIYGYAKNLPPLDLKNRGHYHPEGSEYWLIMKGQIFYNMEGVGQIIAEEGDVVYAPRYTFHAPRWHGEGPSCRLAMNGFTRIAHLFDPH